MDGRPVTETSFVPVFRLRDVAAGSHRLVAQIIDSSGTVLATSEPVAFRMSGPPSTTASEAQ
jgi:hypothetical protein